MLGLKWKPSKFPHPLLTQHLINTLTHYPLMLYIKHFVGLQCAHDARSYIVSDPYCLLYYGTFFHFHYQVMAPI